MIARLTGALYAILPLALTMLAAAQDRPQLAISPEKLVFPSTSAGSQAAPLQITVTNSGTVSVTLQEIIVSGIDFTQTNDCSQQLAAGAKCSIQVVFKPAISGERFGSLEIAASNSPQPTFVPLTGIGQ